MTTNGHRDFDGQHTTNGHALRPSPLLPADFRAPASRTTQGSARLRHLLDTEPFVFAPGVYDPFTA